MVGLRLRVLVKLHWRHLEQPGFQIGQIVNQATAYTSTYLLYNSKFLSVVRTNTISIESRLTAFLTPTTLEIQSLEMSTSLLSSTLMNNGI